MRALIAVLFAACCLFSAVSLSCAEDKIKDEIIAIATETVKAEGMELKDVDIIYDEDGKLWNEKVGYLAGEDRSPNHGILRKGFLKNYKVVLFDFQEPLPDIWVFIDKDTGEVLEISKEEAHPQI